MPRGRRSTPSRRRQRACVWRAWSSVTRPAIGARHCTSTARRPPRCAAESRRAPWKTAGGPGGTLCTRWMLGRRGRSWCIDWQLRRRAGRWRACWRRWRRGHPWTPRTSTAKRPPSWPRPPVTGPWSRRCSSAAPTGAERPMAARRRAASQPPGATSASWRRWPTPSRPRALTSRRPSGVGSTPRRRAPARRRSGRRAACRWHRRRPSSRR
mmetsp:Transcript_21302/g.59559  ORF Transcript_21302/g.59559 Transcript_21302/m.59559 type:complete len:211 (+) Transcript_21302:135-767(+)